VGGKLLLHSMPGRYEPIERVWQQVTQEGIRAIVCLAEQNEIHEKSFDYAQALATERFPTAVQPRTGTHFGSSRVNRRSDCTQGRRS
jgi:hypothetical protein